MKYGITLLGNRVAPRCIYADTILLVSQRRNGLSTRKNLPLPEHSLQDLYNLLMQNHVDILVCGGITRENKEFLESRELQIIDNVACSADDIITALKKGKLHPGFGLQPIATDYAFDPKIAPDRDLSKAFSDDSSAFDEETPDNDKMDCLACLDRACLRGEPCPDEISAISPPQVPDCEMIHMLEAATDIACESERTLCRLSELIYFCLEMNYQRLGVAYCVDLEEPAEILVRVLRRFFEVIPVCCKIGGLKQNNPLRTGTEKNRFNDEKDILCNPWGQAQALNRLKTDFNIMVGICMGADCIFMQNSQSPVTTLFVKDKSLANNPIGALYSDYYLREATQAGKAGN